MTEDHGEHWCGSLIVYDPRTEVHSCTGMCGETDLTIDECTACEERTMTDDQDRQILKAAGRALLDRDVATTIGRAGWCSDCGDYGAGLCPLHAAAPALLAALEWITRCASIPQPYGGVAYAISDERMAAARAAIEQATP